MDYYGSINLLAYQYLEIQNNEIQNGEKRLLAPPSGLIPNKIYHPWSAEHFSRGHQSSSSYKFWNIHDWKIFVTSLTLQINFHLDFTPSNRPRSAEHLCQRHEPTSWWGYLDSDYQIKFVTSAVHRINSQLDFSSPVSCWSAVRVRSILQPYCRRFLCYPVKRSWAKRDVSPNVPPITGGYLKIQGSFRAPSLK